MKAEDVMEGMRIRSHAGVWFVVTGVRPCTGSCIGILGRSDDRLAISDHFVMSENIEVSPRGLVQARDLRPGMVILANGNPVTVSTVTSVSEFRRLVTGTHAASSWVKEFYREEEVPLVYDPTPTPEPTHLAFPCDIAEGDRIKVDGGVIVTVLATRWTADYSTAAFIVTDGNKESVARFSDTDVVTKMGDR